MTATYTFDVFSTLDGYASPSTPEWGAYWGKQGPEFVAHRDTLYSADQRMVFGANTYQLFEMLASAEFADHEMDAWATKMNLLPATVVSNSLKEVSALPNGTVVNGDAVEAITKLKEESAVPLRSHGSISLNRTLLTAGLVDRIELTIFPVITGQTGDCPIFENAADFDLELLESRTFDKHIQVLTYRPTLHA